MLDITKENFKSDVEEYSGLCVIDLWAPWCGPCRMLAPVLAHLEERFPTVRFCRINIDEEPELAGIFHVDSIPLVAFVRDDIFLDLSEGYSPDIEEKLAKMIEEYAAS